MTKKILAVILALACLTGVISLAACSGKDDAATTTTTAAEVETPIEVDSTVPDLTTAEATTLAADETTLAAAQTTLAAEATTAAAAVPQTTEEIVAYFNTAINDVKPNAKSITSNYMEHGPNGSVEGLPSMFNSLADSLIGGNTGRDDKLTNVTWSTAEAKKAFHVEGETWSSKLTADDVKSATLTEKNGVYTITIVTKADDYLANVTHGSNHNPKAFNVVMPSVVSDNIPSAVAKVFSIGTVKIAYPSSTIKVTVDAATGHVKTAYYEMYWTMLIPLGDRNVIIPFFTKTDFTIAY